MVDAILLGISTGLALSGLAGPVFFMMIDTALLESRKQALIISIGALTSDLLIILLAWIITTGFLQLTTEHALFSKIAGIVFIVFGIVNVFKKPKKRENIRPSQLRTALKSFILNTLNPSVIIFWLAAMAIAIPAHHGNGKLIVCQFAVTAITVFVIDIIKIQLAHTLKAWLTPSIIRRVSITIGIGFIVFGGWLLTG